jgi:hypothetical protein
MNNLDKLKEVWKDQKNSKLQFSYDDIQKMLHKKSTSIVKWIFYISILEFCFWLLVSVLVDTDWDKIREFGLYNFMYTLNIINYVIIFAFIVLFYKNYRVISAASTTQKLMSDILKTRKTVYNYVLYNVGMLIFSFAIVLYYIFSNADFLSKLDTAQAGNSTNTTIFMAVAIAIVIVVAIAGLLLLFYRLIYGILLKKLKQNYKELSKD